MLAQFFGAWFTILCLSSVPAVATKRMNEKHMYRCLGLATVSAVVLVAGKSDYSLALLIAGAVVSGSIALTGLENGVKSLFNEIFLLLALCCAFVWTEYRAVFSLDIDAILIQLERLLRSQGFPFERENFGQFTIGGAIGVICSLPLRFLVKRAQRKREEAQASLRARVARREKPTINQMAVSAAKKVHQTSNRKKIQRADLIARALK